MVVREVREVREEVPFMLSGPDYYFSVFGCELIVLRKWEIGIEAV